MAQDRPKLAYRSRLLALLVVVAAVGAPAVALRVLCVGHSCDEEADASGEVPFCSLHSGIREPIVKGFRKGRSPEVIAVTGGGRVIAGDTGRSDPAPTWPSTEGLGAERVPIAFVGPGVAPSDIAPGTSLDDIAPTLAESIDLNRKFPEVRSGSAVPGVIPDRSPTLLVVIAIKGMGTPDLAAGAWPTLERVLDQGAGTTTGSAGSLPLDPAAAIATIGTGGLPSQHGMIGDVVRNDEGELVRAWGKDSPVSVIAALGDDLDELLNQEPLIGVVGSNVSDRGLIGGNWYVDVDRDIVSLTDDPVAATSKILDRGFGDDAVPDLLGVALDGSRPRTDEDLQAVIQAAADASGDRYLVAIAGTGTLELSAAPRVSAERVVRDVERSVPGPTPVVEAPGAGGLFLDQDALVDTGLSEDAVIGPLKRIKEGGNPLIVDAFPAIAVSFSKYC